MRSTEVAVAAASPTCGTAPRRSSGSSRLFGQTRTITRHATTSPASASVSEVHGAASPWTAAKVAGALQSDQGIVVTGIAALTPAGLDPDALWSAYSSGKVTSEPEDGNWVGRVVFDPAEYLPPKDRKRVDRLGLFSVIGAKLALEDAGLELTDENRGRVGAIIGTGVGPMESMELFSRPVIEEGAAAANPAVFPNTVYNAAGGQVAMKVGAVGPASTVTAGHAAGDVAKPDRACHRRRQRQRESRS